MKIANVLIGIIIVMFFITYSEYAEVTHLEPEQQLTILGIAIFVFIVLWVLFYYLFNNNNGDL